MWMIQQEKIAFFQQFFDVIHTSYHAQQQLQQQLRMDN
jgi:hypothetical protein